MYGMHPSPALVTPDEFTQHSTPPHRAPCSFSSTQGILHPHPPAAAPVQMQLAPCYAATGAYFGNCALRSSIENSSSVQITPDCPSAGLLAANGAAAAGGCALASGPPDTGNSGCPGAPGGPGMGNKGDGMPGGPM
mmetsp:Transcript_12276/g.29985  ORF Transcript_12276/g.29985 Transcript_12276/m.29985 type:complete len:136 (-) Transcript_12276:770-1177(-)